MYYTYVLSSQPDRLASFFAGARDKQLERE
jgi:hypothetical protein